MASPRDALDLLAAGRSLSAQEAHDAFAAIMAGAASEAAIAAFLTALHERGETASELIGAVRAVRERMSAWPQQATPLLDTCGTGGDGANSVNISTAAAIVVAACGVPVAKQGNRSATSSSGSAEVLGALGVEYDAEPEIAQRCLAELGITFLFAARYHPAMRFAAPVRKRLPFRTLFNLVGPLVNPAQPRYQLLGVASEPHADLVAQALLELGIDRAAVVTGADGLDEVTLAGPTVVRWVEKGQVRTSVWQPADFGLSRVPAEALRISGPEESASRIRAVFAGVSSPARDVILANAAAALVVAGRAESLQSGIALSAAAIDSGATGELLERWARLSQFGDSRDKELVR